MAEMITSRKNRKIIDAHSLCDKKARDKSGLFATEGIKLLKELISEKVELCEVYFTESAKNRFSDVFSEAEKLCPVYEVTDEVYEKLSFEKSPEGVFAVAKKKSVFKNALETAGDGGFVILDGVQNPSNVGTVIRTAAALGVSRILLGKGCADVFGPKTLRAAMGTVFKVNICVCDDILKEIENLKKSGMKVYGAALEKDSVDIREISFEKDDCIVLGNEGQGISKEVLSLCDKKIIIPMMQNTESLNAASAASVLIWEKQKGVI
jgi:TrmH family RNA methyltransferase